MPAAARRLSRRTSPARPSAPRGRPGYGRYNEEAPAFVQDISAPMFSHDEYQALHEGAALLDRTADRGRLELRGADRRAYLHGLLTNDIAALSAGRRLLRRAADAAGADDQRHARVGARRPPAHRSCRRRRPRRSGSASPISSSARTSRFRTSAARSPSGVCTDPPPRSWRHRSLRSADGCRADALASVPLYGERRADVSRSAGGRHQERRLRRRRLRDPDRCSP